MCDVIWVCIVLFNWCGVLYRGTLHCFILYYCIQRGLCIVMCGVLARLECVMPVWCPENFCLKSQWCVWMGKHSGVRIRRPKGVDGVRPRAREAWTESVHGSGGGGAWTEWTDLTPLPHQISLPHHTHTIITAIHVCVLFSVVCLLVYDDKIVTMYYLSLICNNKLCWTI